MSVARAKLVGRASLLRDAAASSDLVSKPPTEILWNEHARLVKAGLCISVFSSLEEFIRDRVVEVLQKLQGFSPASAGMPKALKDAFVIGAFEVMAGRIKDPKKFGISNLHPYVLTQAGKIASFATGWLDPSELALATNASNLSWQVIENALSAFAVENPPSVLSGVARRIEGGIFVAKDHFENVMLWRHKIAHVSGADVPLADIKVYVDKLILFCAAFDMVLSTAASRVLSAAVAPSSPTTRTVDIGLRYVEKHNGQWRDRRENSTRGASRHADQAAAIFASEALARTKNECVLVRIEAMTSASTTWATPFF